jgi:uncharacterized membrane protein YedE/YeeE
MLVGRRLGASGVWERVLNWRSELEAERADVVLDDAAAFEAALAAETAAAFGGSAVAGSVATKTAAGAEPAGPPATVEIEKRLPLSTQWLLLLSILAGGALAAVVSGRFKWRTDMGAAFSNVVAHGWLMWPVLFVGGILVGVGTRMAGGCSTGHGLSSCSRLQPVSLVATATFFASAVGMSFLVWKVI